MHFYADADVYVISNETKDTPLRQFSLSILHLFDSIFPGLALIDKLHDFEERTCFPIKGCYGSRNDYHSNGSYEQKMLYQKLESYRFELTLKKLGWLGQYKI